MDIQKEPFLSKDQYECLEFLKTWGLNKVEFDENKQIIGITRQSHCDLSTREIELIMRAWQAKSQAVPECVWVESYDGSVFERSCGHTFELSNDGTLDDNNMKHCCFCGGKIEAQEQSHE